VASMLLLTSKVTTTSMPFLEMLSALPGLRKFDTAITPRPKANENKMNFEVNKPEEKVLINCRTSFSSPILLTVLRFHLMSKRNSKTKIPIAVNSQSNSLY
jgi:hypothetical protein